MKQGYAIRSHLLIAAFAASVAGAGVGASVALGGGMGATFAVSAFGARGDGRADDGPAIQRAIDAAVAAGGGSVVAFDAGRTYRLAMKASDLAILRIDRARGLTLAGNGAVLVAHPSNRPLTIYESGEVTVRDLTLDYDPIPFTQARITETLLDAGAIRFRIEPGYADPATGGRDVYPDFKSSDAVFLEGATRRFTHDWARLREVRPLGGREFEARFHAPDIARRLARVRTGDFIAIKLPFAPVRPLRDADGRFMSGSSNVYVTASSGILFERIVSHAAPGMTFIATGSEGVVLEACRVIRKPGTDRLIAGNSDAAHLKSLTVLPRIRDCLFEAVMDDSVNIKVSSEIVREISGRRIRLEHGDGSTDDLVLKPGQTLAFVGRSTKKHLGFAKIEAVARVRYQEAWVTLDAAVAGLMPEDRAYLKPATDAVVERCEFRSQLKIGLVLSTPGIVSDCVFDGIAYGVHTAFQYSENQGPPDHATRVFRCRFLRPTSAAIGLYLPARDSAAMPRQALVAEDCSITMGGGRGLAISAINEHGIHLRNITVIAEDGRTRERLVAYRNCGDVREEHVVFMAADTRPGNAKPTPRDAAPK